MDFSFPTQNKLTAFKKDLKQPQKFLNNQIILSSAPGFYLPVPITHGKASLRAELKMASLLPMMCQTCICPIQNWLCFLHAKPHLAILKEVKECMVCKEL